MSADLDFGDSPGMKLAAAGMGLAMLGMGFEFLRGVIKTSPELGRKALAMARGELGDALRLEAPVAEYRPVQFGARSTEQPTNAEEAPPCPSD